MPRRKGLQAVTRNQPQWEGKGVYEASVEERIGQSRESLIVLGTDVFAAVGSLTAFQAHNGRDY
jgi:hypothetical protein